MAAGAGFANLGTRAHCRIVDAIPEHHLGSNCASSCADLPGGPSLARPGRPLEAHMDNLREFRDPVNYDLEELPGSADRIAFMCRRALRVAGPALDLGCGTGIVALPLAVMGLAVTGLDLSDAMVAHARHKAATLGVKASFSVQDMRCFDLQRTFRFIALTGHAFQALLARSDQSMLLQAVARHLEDEGEFVFETRNPAGTDLVSSTEEEPWFAYVNASGNEVQVSGTQSYDQTRQVLTWTTSRRWSTDGGPRLQRSDIACRFTEVQELDSLLNAAGLRVKERYGAWDGRPFTSASEEIITVCERVRGPSVEVCATPPT